MCKFCRLQRATRDRRNFPFNRRSKLTARETGETENHENSSERMFACISVFESFSLSARYNSEKRGIMHNKNTNTAIQVIQVKMILFEKMRDKQLLPSKHYAFLFGKFSTVYSAHFSLSPTPSAGPLFLSRVCLLYLRVSRAKCVENMCART